MPIDFSRFNNHTATNDENYDLIVFGHGAEVLEVELNELQSIFNTKFMNRFIYEGNGVLVNIMEFIKVESESSGTWSEVDLDTGYINSGSNYRIRAKGVIPILIDGQVFRVPDNVIIATSPAASSATSPAGKLVKELLTDLYLNYKISDITEGTKIYKYGWVGDSKEEIATQIIDNRDNEETSRRRVLSFNITRVTPDNTNFTTSKVINTDYRYLSSSISQRYIIDNLLKIINDIDYIKTKYVLISKFDTYLKLATTENPGIVRLAKDEEVKKYQGNGVVQAHQLSNILDAKSVVNLVYPVGSIYMTINDSASPNTLFPGTEWERLPSGYYLTSGVYKTRQNSHSINDNSTTVVHKSNLPAITLEGSGSTNHGGGHYHQVNDHAHLVPEHKHIVPWGNYSYYDNRSEAYPWGSPLKDWKEAGRPPGWLDPHQRGLPYTGIGSHGGLDWDNEWFYTSPTAVWTHGSSPYTNESGGHSHSFSFRTEQLGNGAELDINLRNISVILWRRVR